VPYPSLDIYFSDDKLKKEPGIWLLELISTQLDPDPHFFMRIWIQEANLLKIRADPDLKHCFKVTLSQNCFYVKKKTPPRPTRSMLKESPSSNVFSVPGVFEPGEFLFQLEHLRKFEN
jgi:hypothetical protein